MVMVMWISSSWLGSDRLTPAYTSDSTKLTTAAGGGGDGGEGRGE